MNLLGSIVLALVVSIALAGGAGMMFSALAGDSDFFFVVVVAAMGLSVAFILPFAATTLRPERRRATRRLALVLAVVLALIAFAMAAAHFGAQGTLAATWPGVKRMLVLLVSCELVVLVYWLVFRRAPTTKSEPVMQFGRAGASGTGGMK